MTLNRKRFISQSAIVSTAVMFGHTTLRTFFASEKIKELSLITNVIEDQLRADWKKTLAEVAGIGYKSIEFDTIPGATPSEVKEYLKTIGMQPLAAGSVMSQLLNEERLKKIINDALYLNKKYLICYWPWLDNGQNKKLDDFKIASENLNNVGELCKKEGIRLAYHNHDKEFVAVDGYQWGYEVFLTETNPSFVTALMDIYWVTKGGADPVKLLKKFPGRFELLHVKDMDATPAKSYTCPGQGVIDFPTIFSHATLAGVQHYIVEIDRAANPMQCIRDSYNYLHGLQF